MQPEILYTVSGRVLHGKGRGKSVGMPTVNLALNPQMPLPKLGVYASLVYLDDAVYTGVTNLGYRPTVDCEKLVTCETLILHFDADLYEKNLRVDLLYYLRPTRKMRSLEEVHEQVKIDSALAEKLLKNINS